MDTSVTRVNGSVTASVAPHGQSGGQQAPSRASSIEANTLAAINSVFGSGGAPSSTPSITSVSAGAWSRNSTMPRTPSSSGGVVYNRSTTGQNISNFSPHFVGSDVITSSSSSSGVRMDVPARGGGGRTVYGRSGGFMNGVVGRHSFVGAVGRNATSSQIMSINAGAGSSMPSPSVMEGAGGVALNPAFSSSLCLSSNAPPVIATGLGIGNSPGFASDNDIMDGLGLPSNNNNRGFPDSGSALFGDGSMAVAPGDVGGHETGDAGASDFTGNAKSDGLWAGLYEVRDDMQVSSWMD